MSSVKEKLKRIFGYRKFFSSDECTIDSLVRIDENIYECDNCILADTKDVKRDDILGREICPLEVKGDIYALR